MNDESTSPDIVLVESRLDRVELRRLVAAHFEDMVKYVVDVERGVAAVGGELHADEEALLLERGSRQDDLWGATTTRDVARKPASSTPRSSIFDQPRETGAW